MNKKTRPKRYSYNKLENTIFAHRLKHGLTAIKWSLKMILSGDFGEINNEQKDIIEKSLGENEKLILIANNLLDEGPGGYPAKGSKKFLDKDLYNAELIVDSVIKSYEAKIREKKINLEFIRPEEKIEAFLDREKVKIAIQNILDNAIRYTPDNGKIIISLNRGRDNLELKVQDYGIGIPENQKEKLFTKFFRGSNTTEANSEGSGLGLFIAKNIIEAHKGKIWFDSIEGQGSTFYFTLPIKS